MQVIFLKLPSERSPDGLINKRISGIASALHISFRGTPTSLLTPSIVIKISRGRWRGCKQYIFGAKVRHSAGVPRKLIHVKQRPESSLILAIAFRTPACLPVGRLAAFT